MSSYIDQKYILLIASNVEHFKQLKPSLYRCRCPYCGDSQKKKFKARGFIYERKGDFFFRCHNCSYGTSLGGFIKHLDHIIYKQYIMEKFGNHKEDVPLLKTEIRHIRPVFSEKIQLLTISELEFDHWVRKYVSDRKIPEQFYHSLYFAPSFKYFVDNLLPNHNKDLIENDPRLIIPFYDEEKNLIAFQGRALNSNKTRYITIKIDEDNPKVFGLDRVNKNNTVYVLEGPIDSMMLENAVAACDSSLRAASKYLPKENLVLVFDNQYHNKEVKQQIERSIEDGFKVCLFPRKTKEKDLNEIIMNGLSREDLQKNIDLYTYHGIRATFEFNLIKG